MPTRSKGFDLQRLESLAEKMYRKPFGNLSSFDARGVIDLLKSIKAGTIKLGDALNRAAARA